VWGKGRMGSQPAGILWGLWGNQAAERAGLALPETESPLCAKSTPTGAFWTVSWVNKVICSPHKGLGSLPHQHQQYQT
jgi:hypothetical protein